jgi:KUP system potassium uptake protein
MVHTSPDQEGQVYSPEVNYILMILCVGVVLGFRDGVQLGNAFGKLFRLYFTTLKFLCYEDSCLF